MVSFAFSFLATAREQYSCGNTIGWRSLGSCDIGPHVCIPPRHIPRIAFVLGSYESGVVFAVVAWYRLLRDTTGQFVAVKSTRVRLQFLILLDIASVLGGGIVGLPSARKYHVVGEVAMRKRG